MANALVLLGSGSSGSNGTLTPPSVAPVLTVSAEFGSDVANLEWTSSNKTGSSGFGYNIYVNINGAGYNLRDTVLGTTQTYNDDNSGAAGETYEYKVIPKNDAGEGPSSNAASVVLPGESEAPVLTGPSTGVTNVEFTLAWTSVPGADSYEVDHSDDGGLNWTTIATTSSLSTHVLETAANTYDYRVTPFAGAFQGITSNIVTVVVSGASSYLRPGGVYTYLRPDGTSTYYRP
jgi:fibronectin type 3 domain-containing protein